MAQGIELLKARAEAEAIEIQALKLLFEERRQGHSSLPMKWASGLLRWSSVSAAMPTYAFEFATEAERDFELIFDFLEECYLSFGESTDEAIMHAARRLQAIHTKAAKLGKTPRRGTLHPEITPDLRHVTMDQVIYWFLLDDDALKVRVLAIFFGGQDHVRRMLARLLQHS